MYRKSVYNITRVTVIVAGILWFCGANVAAERVIVRVFEAADIHFAPERAASASADDITASDNGREISRTIELPSFDSTVTITARLAIHPIPMDALSVHDKWDRAGNVRLAVPGQADIEIVKFITAYGGFTEYEVDVSHLAPLLAGTCTITAFIDTWVSPAWTMDFELEFQTDTNRVAPVWIYGLLYEPSFDREHMADTGVAVAVNVPPGLDRVMLHYYVSGHCTDGRGADEFEPKDNVIAVDDVVVYRFRPWRDDCRRFRAINPYTKRWSDGYWSSDYSRSGWCPGDIVAPLELDLSDHLTGGDHSLRFRIEDIRPKDSDGNYGYWRVSAFLVGYSLAK
ncbi:MAG: peptide-N-glycosidase F-related protein [bacterium]